jgi:hypothetical protein
MAASTTPDEAVRTLTLPVVKGSETNKTIRFREAGVEASKSSILVWANKDLLDQLGADNVKDLTVVLSATKSKPGVVVEPPLEAGASS